MNFINIAGHLGADPEVRFTSSGKKVTTLRVATKTRRGGKNEDDTIWWRVTVWGEQFDKMISFLKKGSPVVVFGELHKPEIFNDREGKPQISMEITASLIQFSPFGKPGGSEGGHQQSSPQQQHYHHQAAPAAPFGVPHPQQGENPYNNMAKSPAPKGDTFDDEVPF